MNYEKHTFKAFLSGQMPIEQANELLKDPIFEEELKFYVELQTVAKELKAEYLEPVEEATRFAMVNDKIEAPSIQPKSQPIWVTFLPRVAAIAAAASGAFLLFPRQEQLTMGESKWEFPTENLLAGAILLILSVVLLLYFRKK